MIEFIAVTVVQSSNRSVCNCRPEFEDCSLSSQTTRLLDTKLSEFFAVTFVYVLHYNFMATQTWYALRLEDVKVKVKCLYRH